MFNLRIFHKVYVEKPKDSTQEGVIELEKAKVQDTLGALQMDTTKIEEQKKLTDIPDQASKSDSIVSQTSENTQTQTEERENKSQELSTIKKERDSVAREKTKHVKMFWIKG